MNKFVTGLNAEYDHVLTENGGKAYRSAGNALMDLFAHGGAYRQRNETDCILLFQKAYKENPTYALKCLFYLRDILEGQGERRFFRVCLNWLAKKDTDAVVRNIESIPELGRWDDLYELVDTPAEHAAFDFIKRQLTLDVQSKTPSLLGKWLKSENASAKRTRYLGMKTRNALGMNARLYRKTLSMLRKRINIVERLMSAGQWDLIEFDKIPSQAGFRYRNAFARRDILKQKYEKFIKDEKTTVNARAMAPYEVVAQAPRVYRKGLDDVERVAINKYWDNLHDYFEGCSLNALCMIDTSGSMTWGGTNNVLPIDVATSLGLYAAEKAQGPFHGTYISFSSRPQLIKTDGVDFVDKVRRIRETDLCENTNLAAAFDMLLNVAIKNRCRQDELPAKIVVITDGEFDSMVYNDRSGDRYDYWNHHRSSALEGWESVAETITRKWADYGYKMPELIFWNVNSRNDQVPMKMQHGVSLVSGFSASTFQMVMSDKSGVDLMYEVLDRERYANIK